MIKPIPSSDDRIRTALAATRMGILSLTEKLATLDGQELYAGSSDRPLIIRMAALRAKMLMKYFAVDQEFNLVRSYTFDPGGLMRRSATTREG